MTFKRSAVFIFIVVGLFSMATAVSAQTPRPTPTNVGGVSEESSDSSERGSIQGHVYQDVNGDGVCVNSGVEGEGPISGIPVEFVSSDEQTVITVTSGEDGSFGLFAAGQSNWRVTAQSGNGWSVVSENPLYVPVYPETLGHTGVDFCVVQGDAMTGNGVIVIDSAEGSVLLPEAGAAAELPQNGRSLAFVWVTAVFGLLVFLVGAGLQRRQKSE